jgi:hypothetical protein
MKRADSASCRYAFGPRQGAARLKPAAWTALPAPAQPPPPRPPRPLQLGPQPCHLPLGIGLHVGDTGALAVGLFTPQAGILAGAIQFIPNLLQLNGMASRVRTANVTIRPGTVPQLP